MLLRGEDPFPNLLRVPAQGLLDEPARLQIALHEAGLEVAVETHHVVEDKDLSVCVGPGPDPHGVDGKPLGDLLGQAGLGQTR